MTRRRKRKLVAESSQDADLLDNEDNEESVSLNTIPNSEIDDHPPQHKRSTLSKSSITINPVPAKKSKHSPGRTPHAEKWGSYAKENVSAELFCICRQKEVEDGE